jgi:mRNA-degrading endonuclease RelE of RelBE toxin-antitoxin system
MQPAEPDRSILHTLIDQISPDHLVAAESVLRALAIGTDPVAVALRDAPIDNEPLSPREIESLAALERALSRGERLESAHPDDLLTAFGFDSDRKWARANSRGPPVFDRTLRRFQTHLWFSFFETSLFAKIGVGDVSKLEGMPERWRIRSGNYRAIFIIQPDGSLIFTQAGNRKDIY